MNFENLLEIQPNREPFLFIEEIIDVQEGKNAIAIKHLDNNEWYFKCHWHGDPNMPGMLQLETMSQTASLCIFCSKNPPSKLYLVSVNNAVFRKKISPGDSIRITSEVTSIINNIYKFKCKIYFLKDLKVASKADIELAVPN
tara:strand:- start:3219 stop:3644 length:426 start_codon:yes stop_codon:yes gene_type:complete